MYSDYFHISIIECKGDRYMIFENNIVVCEDAIFDKSHKNPVYIVLMHTGTPMATLIKKVTGDEFSHACISFNSKLDPLYSFGSKAGGSGIGFCVNNPKDAVFKQYHSKYSVYVMYVTDKAYSAMKSRLKYFTDHAKELKYDIIGLFNIWFNRSSENHEKWFCSRFVMELVSKATSLAKVPSLWKPSDITDLDNISIVSKGFDFFNYDYKTTEKQCKKIKDHKYDATKVMFESEEDGITDDDELVDEDLDDITLKSYKNPATTLKSKMTRKKNKNVQIGKYDISIQVATPQPPSPPPSPAIASPSKK